MCSRARIENLAAMVMVRRARTRRGGDVRADHVWPMATGSAADAAYVGVDGRLQAALDADTSNARCRAIIEEQTGLGSTTSVIGSPAPSWPARPLRPPQVHPGPTLIAGRSRCRGAPGARGGQRPAAVKPIVAERIGRNADAVPRSRQRITRRSP